MFETKYGLGAIGKDWHNRSVETLLFDSVAEMGEYARDHGKADKNRDGNAFTGEMGFNAAVATSRTGDMSAVAASDALLERFDAVSPATRGNIWADDVAGAFPNVPAFVAGTPLSMRRKVKRESERAPLAVIVDCTCSGGISAAEMQKRGVAILALVRALATLRPVELWAGSILGAHDDRQGVAMFARIETTPLDLATACFALSHVAFLRQLGFAIGKKYGFAGGWPWCDVNGTRKHLRDVVAPAMSHVGECLAIPAALYKGDDITDPIKWINAKLTEYGVADIGDAVTAAE